MKSQSGKVFNTTAYNKASHASSAAITKAFSTSFGVAIMFFPRKLRPHIYNIYGLMRVADEIVDTYRGPDAGQLLDELERETYAALERSYSANIIVHAFTVTANRYGINRELIEPFFASMRMDIIQQTYSKEMYERYIHGSAEVVGLMCLRVFCEGNTAQYAQLAPSASALGSAFQKVNFLRDMVVDNKELQRTYFPQLRTKDITEATKQAIIADIRQDFAKAHAGILQLPQAARPAVSAAYRYYLALLRKIERTSIATLQTARVRIPNGQKAFLLLCTMYIERMRNIRG